MKNKSAVIVVWIFFIFIFLVSFLSEYGYVIEDMQINPFDYARITDVEYKAVVVDEPNSQGKIVITERLTFDIHAASKDNLFWELWRDLPEDYIDGVKVHYKVNSVKQILDDGTEIIYDESPKLYWDDEDYVSSNRIYGPGKWYHSEGPYDEEAAQYECVFFYVDGLYREEVVFEIEYEMYNAALKYNDCSDLYIALYSESTINHLESFEAQILFPEEDMPAKGNYDVFTYGTNANDFPVKESDTMNPGYYTFYFELDEEDLQFRPYNEYIEFDLVAYGDDKHIFTDYAPANYYTNDDVLDEIYAEQENYASAPDVYKTAKTVLFAILLTGALSTLVYSLTAKNRIRAKYIFYEPTYKFNFYNEIPSDLDPNFAAALVFCKHTPPKDDSGVYSAILLSLARKKYVWLNDFGINDVQITLIKDSVQTYEPLTPCEEHYYNLLARHATGKTILMSDFQQRVASDYLNTASFATNMKNSIVNIGVNKGYFQKADYMEPVKSNKSFANFLWIAGILIIILANIISYQTRMDLVYGGYFILGLSGIISSIIIKKQASKHVLLTQYGEDEYAKWRGLYSFLKNEAQIKNSTITELPVWEKYLVYATAFGLSEKVTDAISIKCPQASNIPSESRSVFNNNYYRSGRYHHHGRSFRSSVRSGSYSAHSGGGSYGGGGGFGGGGRGGGGGGGGH